MDMENGLVVSGGEEGKGMGKMKCKKLILKKEKR